MALKVALLAFCPFPEEFKQRTFPKVYEALKAKGCEFVDLYLTDISLSFINGQATVFVNGKEFNEKLDIILPFYRKTDIWADSILQALERNGSFVPNIKYGRKINKAMMANRFAEFDIPAPDTNLFYTKEQCSEFAEQLLDFPIVIKKSFSCRGQGVFLANNSQEFKTITHQLIDEDNIAISQKMITPAGVNIRLFLVGGKLVCSYINKNKDSSEFRSNVGENFKELIEPLAEEHVIAEKIAKAFDFDFIAVDVMRSQAGSKVLEINIAPGISGFTNLGVELDSIIADYCIDQSK